MRDRDEKTGVQLRMNAKTTNNDNNSNERRWGKDCYHCIFERMYVCMEEINARNIIFLVLRKCRAAVKSSNNSAE